MNPKDQTEHTRRVAAIQSELNRAVAHTRDPEIQKGILQARMAGTRDPLEKGVICRALKALREGQPIAGSFADPEKAQAVRLMGGWRF
jgi:hypothetical protein